MTDESDQPQSEKQPVIHDLGDDEQAVHWLKIVDYHEDEISRLQEEIKGHKARAEEARDEIMADAPNGWDFVKIRGVAAFSREEKKGQPRVYIEDLREKYPKIEAELKRSKPIEKITRVGK